MTASSISVLLIEDNPIHTRLLQGLLSDAQGPAFAVETADHLAVGLARLGQGGIDAVLLDLVLPDSQEMATLERVKEDVGVHDRRDKLRGRNRRQRRIDRRHGWKLRVGSSWCWSGSRCMGAIEGSKT